MTAPQFLLGDSVHYAKGSTTNWTVTAVHPDGAVDLESDVTISRARWSRPATRRHVNPDRLRLVWRKP
jgi:hypothetical protein